MIWMLSGSVEPTSRSCYRFQIRSLDSTHVSNLSGTFATDAAGLPRGRTSLDNDDVREQQRRRIIKGAITAFAHQGYATTTISDIVKNARVSRQVFYELFKTKEACFLAAEALGRQALQTNMLAQTASSGTTDPQQLVRNMIHAYLQLCQDEPEFAKAWAIEFPGISATALHQRTEYFQLLAVTLRQWHQSIPQSDALHPVDIPDLYYDMAIGGIYEVVYQHLAHDRFDALAGLEDTLVQFMLHTLGFKASA